MTLEKKELKKFKIIKTKFFITFKKTKLILYYKRLQYIINTQLFKFVFIYNIMACHDRLEDKTIFL
jgi:hypothetical protein